MEATVSDDAPSPMPASDTTGPDISDSAGSIRESATSVSWKRVLPMPFHLGDNHPVLHFKDLNIVGMDTEPPAFLYRTAR